MIVGLLSIYVTQIMSVNLWIIHNTQTEFHMLCPYHCSRREKFGGEKKHTPKDQHCRNITQTDNLLTLHVHFFIPMLLRETRNLAYSWWKWGLCVIHRILCIFINIQVQHWYLQCRCRHNMYQRLSKKSLIICLQDQKLIKETSMHVRT